MADPDPVFKGVLVRDAYVRIFETLLAFVEKMHAKHRSANAVVTGNPGVGTSRLYLYLIWRLTTTATKEETSSSLVLVLNYNQRYWRFLAHQHEFVELTKDDVEAIKTTPNVLRLINDRTDSMERWPGGISVLFTSVDPPPPDLERFSKMAIHFIVPPWTLHELEERNALVSDQEKLSRDELVRRVHRFGGIPRAVFAEGFIADQYDLSLEAVLAKEEVVEKAIQAASTVHAVGDGSRMDERLFVMVPDRPDGRPSFHLEFISESVATAVIDKTQRDGFRTLSACAALHNDGHFVTRASLYPRMGHRWFTVQDHFSLQLRSLSVSVLDERVELTKPTEVLFDGLSNASLLLGYETTVFYRPRSKEVCAGMDAIVVQPNRQYFCLRFTVDKDPKVEVEALEQVAAALRLQVSALPVLLWPDVGPLKFVFVVPSKLASEFAGRPTQRNVRPFVCGLDFA